MENKFSYDVSTKPLSELISLKNRTAVVTGGARGIGFAIVKRLAEAGANIAIGDLNFDGLEKEFYKRRTDFGKLHKDFFPEFIFQVKARYEMNKDEKYFQLLEDLSSINKCLGTEIYQSKNYLDSLEGRFTDYFDIANENYPILKIKEFIANIQVD